MGSREGNEKMTAGQWINLAHIILNRPIVKAATKEDMAISSGVWCIR